MKIEIRSNDCAVISGYVNAVERRSRVISRPGAPPFREIVRPGTFRKALEAADRVELMLNHERTLCDTSSGLELREDNVGLYAKAVVSDKETVDAARAGRLTGWSFGFECRADTWKKDEDGTELRELDEIRLSEVSVLTKTPAYVATSVEVREDGTMNERRCTPDEAEVSTEKPDFSVINAELEILSLSLGGQNL